MQTQTQPRENINRILVKTPTEKIMLHSMKKEVVNREFTIVVHNFKALRYEKKLSHGI